MVTCTLPFNLRYADDTTLMAESKEEVENKENKEPLDEGKGREGEKLA